MKMHSLTATYTRSWHMPHRAKLRLQNRACVSMSAPLIYIQSFLPPLSHIDDVCHHLDRESESANGSLSCRFSARVIPRPLPPPLPYTNVTVLHFPPPPSHPHPPLPSIYVTLFPILTYPRKPSLIPYPTSPHDWVHQHDGLHCFMWTVLLPGFK